MIRGREYHHVGLVGGIRVTAPRWCIWNCIDISFSNEISGLWRSCIRTGWFTSLSLSYDERHSFTSKVFIFKFNNTTVEFKMAPAILSSLLLASLAAVVSARNCKNLKIPLSLSSQNMDFTFKAPTNDIEVTNFVLNSGQAGVNYADEILSETKVSVGSISSTSPLPRHHTLLLQV